MFVYILIGAPIVPLSSLRCNIDKQTLTKFIENKSTQIAQTSLAKAAHYPYIAWIPD